MDASVLIFVALAVAWVAYLVPKALQRDDDSVARTVDSFSHRLRVFGGASRAVTSEAGEVDLEPALPPTDPRPEPTQAPVRPVTRTSARRAAARRRRVLLVLIAVLAAVAGVAASGTLPWTTLAAPIVLVVAFLVTARLTVRREQRARLPRVRRPAAPVARPEAPAASAAAAGPSTSVDPSPTEDTIGVSREALAKAIAEQAAEPVADEGSLWDPLPVTLPTYVSKPRARRTVRTIELTASSGHDAADSKLARDAEAARAAQTETAPAPESAEQRKAAGA